MDGPVDVIIAVRCKRQASMGSRYSGSICGECTWHDMHVSVMCTLHCRLSAFIFWLKEEFGDVSKKVEDWAKLFVVEMLRTIQAPRCPISTDDRASCGVWSGATKMPNFVFWCVAAFRQNAKWRFWVMWWPPSVAVVCRRRSASITKWPARISQERVDLVPPNFILTSTPTHSTATQDMTSRATEGIAKTVENAASDGFWSNFSRMVEARITQFYTLIGTITYRKLPDMTSLSE